jgi:hypothetical protein
MTQKNNPIISDRLVWLKHKSVQVKVDNGSTFTGEYVDTLPLGRTYFFLFKVDDRARLVDTSKIIELIQQ